MHDKFLILLVVIILFLPIGIWLHYVERSKVSRYFTSQGYKIYDIKLSIFSFDALFEKNERHYTVRYYDDDNSLHVCVCKTTLLTSVYIKEDYIIYKEKESK
ncbi:MAG: hypothetical protein ACLFMO_07885 [Eubacteriales bacterium]